MSVTLENASLENRGDCDSQHLKPKILEKDEEDRILSDQLMSHHLTPTEKNEESIDENETQKNVLSSLV